MAAALHSDCTSPSCQCRAHWQRQSTLPVQCQRRDATDTAATPPPHRCAVSCRRSRIAVSGPELLWLRGPYSKVYCRSKDSGAMQHRDAGGLGYRRSLGGRHLRHWSTAGINLSPSLQESLSSGRHQHLEQWPGNDGTPVNDEPERCKLCQMASGPTTSSGSRCDVRCMQ